MENRQDRGQRYETGRRGEDAACGFLIANGHTVIERNWRYRHLEIDIISIDNDGIHFVEVKTRRPPMQADPQESVDWKKRLRITEAAKGYMRQKGTDAECHFDIVSVIFEKGRTVVRMFPDAYFPGL